MMRTNGRGIEIESGIVMFKGSLSKNLLWEPMVSHAYFLDDGENVVVYDPSCGDEIGGQMEAHIRHRRDAGAAWRNAFVVAGHSHMDHANNMYIADRTGASNVRIFLHEESFQDGRVMNQPSIMFERLVTDAGTHFNRYLSFTYPYNLLMIPFAVLGNFFPGYTRNLFGRIASLNWPAPQNGAHLPEPLRESDLQEVDMGGIRMKGWKVGEKIIFPSPGHSPCSVSLYWPDKKALFVSDADWIGNPVFLFSSLRDCLTSLEKFRQLTLEGRVDIFLPAHGLVKKGRRQILSHLRFLRGRLESMRDDVRTAYRASGEKNIRKLSNRLIKESPLFRTLMHSGSPRMVVNVNDIVAVCLREDGLLA